MGTTRLKRNQDSRKLDKQQTFIEELADASGKLVGRIGILDRRRTVGFAPMTMCSIRQELGIGPMDEIF